MDKLEPDQYYHILNRANGNEVLFKEEENYFFFLEKYKKHVHPAVHTLAYALMGNHFHLVVHVRPIVQLEQTFPKFKTLEKLDNGSNFISKQFSNFFSSYTQAYNKMYDRHGSLFQKNFKRNHLVGHKHLQNAILYVHRNPVHHGFCNRMQDWSFSSYNSLSSSKPTLLARNKVFQIFEGEENFFKQHTSITQKWLLEHENKFEYY